MKFLIPVSLFFLALGAFAGEKSAALFEDLNVAYDEVISVDGSTFIHTKQVGGLSCTRSLPTQPSPDARYAPNYSCTIAVDGRNDQAIYDALFVAAKSAGRNAFTKKARVVECFALLNDSPPHATTYRCVFDL